MTKGKGSYMDRRDFLKGIGVTGVTAAAAGALAACSSGADTASTGSEDTVADTATSADGSGVFGYLDDGIDWLGEAPSIDENEIVETVEADIVVVGGGHAGTACAMNASDNGARVAVIEKADSLETHHYVGGEFGNFNSMFLESRGFSGYDLGQIVREFCIRGGGRVNPMLISKYVENSGPCIDKMLEAIPADDEILSEEQLTVHVAYGHLTGADYPIYSGGYYTWAGDTQFWGPYNDQPVDGVASFSTITKAWNYTIERITKENATWYWGHEGIVLTQDADGSVTGVIAKRKEDDAYVRFSASKGVVLCSGGFESNREMCWSLITEMAEWNERSGITRDDYINGDGFAMTTNDGSGHKMGCWAGGHIEAHPRATMDMGGGGGGPWGHSPFLVLNAAGKRFCNEASAVQLSPVTRRQPIGITCTVTDSKWLQTVHLASVDHGCPNYTRPQYYDDLVTDMEAVVPAGAEGAGVRSACITERNLATVYGAEDLETALRYAGYTDAEIPICLEEIAAYNELCYAGKDIRFGKDAEAMLPIDEPPYYTSPSSNSATQTMVMVTLCGLDADENMNVLGDNRIPIPGLYAAGNCLGNRWGNNYSTPTGGASIGMAATHGYVVGGYLATL